MTNYLKRFYQSLQTKVIKWTPVINGKDSLFTETDAIGAFQDAREKVPRLLASIDAVLMRDDISESLRSDITQIQGEALSVMNTLKHSNGDYVGLDRIPVYQKDDKIIGAYISKDELFDAIISEHVEKNINVKDENNQLDLVSNCKNWHRKLQVYFELNGIKSFGGKPESIRREVQKRLEKSLIRETIDEVIDQIDRTNHSLDSVCEEQLSEIQAYWKKEKIKYFWKDWKSLKISVLAEISRKYSNDNSD